jgi:4-hydroxybenzoate polyprenyltransferase
MDNQKIKPNKNLAYRFSQLMGFILGARFFVAIILTFALYVSTFFLFNQEENLRNFVFDFKVHGIIFCSVLSILAGGIINQFYDVEKDHFVKPFRTRIQSFLKQKYFLTMYIILNTLSLGIAWFISWRVFVFFLIYQFFMWFYSHKLSRVLFLNNLTFVGLTLYPFFGMMVYYETFSKKLFLMAVFIFLLLLCIDIVKDTLTRKADKAFGYDTIPNFFDVKITKIIISGLLSLMIVVALLLIWKSGIEGFMGYYFAASAAVFGICIYFIVQFSRKSRFLVLNFLRVWIFIGILAMLFYGIEFKF